MTSRISEISLHLRRPEILRITKEEKRKYILNFGKFSNQIFHPFEDFIVLLSPLIIWTGQVGIYYLSLKLIAKVANHFGWIDLQQIEDDLNQLLDHYLNPQHHHQQQQQQQPNTFSLMRCYG